MKTTKFNFWTTIKKPRIFTPWNFLRLRYHILLGAFSLYALILPWQKTAVNLNAAHKKTDSCALLTCFLISCITQIITHMQHTKNSSHAIHGSWLACNLFCITRVFWLETRQKLKNTCMFTTCECQLRCELYCMM